MKNVILDCAVVRFVMQILMLMVRNPLTKQLATNVSTFVPAVKKFTVIMRATTATIVVHFPVWKTVVTIVGHVMIHRLPHFATIVMRKDVGLSVLNVFQKRMVVETVLQNALSVKYGSALSTRRIVGKAIVQPSQ